VSLREHNAGELQRLGAFTESLCRACGQVASDLSDIRQALQPVAHPPVTEFDLGSDELDPHATASDYGYASLRRAFFEFLRYGPGTRLGEDPEQLHQMRVAARRFRALTGLFKPALSPRIISLGKEIKWVAGILGAARDLDVQREWLLSITTESAENNTAAISPLLSRLDQRVSQTRREVVSALDSERFKALTQAMILALRDDYESSDEAELPVHVFAEQGLRNRYRSFHKQARRLRLNSPDTELHALRVKTKRLRYAVECFRPIFGSGVKSMVDETKALQDLLGEHQDCAVFSEKVRTALSSDSTVLPPATLIRLGELIEQRRQRMVEIRALWPKHYKRVKQGWRLARKALKTSRHNLALSYIQSGLVTDRAPRIRAIPGQKPPRR
jgi:CHAD domain-containing protein